MSKSQKIPLIIIGLGIVIVVSISLYVFVLDGGYAWVTWSNSKQNSVTQSAIDNNDPTICDQLPTAVPDIEPRLECHIAYTAHFATTTSKTNLVSNTTEKTYIDNAFGFSLTYPQSLIISFNGAEKINLSIQGSTNSPTTITKTTGSGTDSNGKWGPVAISYSGSGWVIQKESDQTGSLYSEPTSPVMYTTSGLPIFNGAINGHGWGMYSYIIALSHTKFITITGPDNSIDGPYNSNTDPTIPIVKSVSTI